ncbi:hypothetical protein SY88_06480 [Clostridiales bacterium PH28_bin88]|nr:hypothetical protein SY88_06480 [Clostridiales bacterium PH28_bin88]
MQLAVLGGKPIRREPFPIWPSISVEAISAVQEVLKNGRLGGNVPGGQIEAFEKEFAAYIGVPFAVAVCNGTVALSMALQATGVGPGDEVAVPSVSFIATATAVSLIGALPVFVDVDPDYNCMDPTSLEKALSSKTVAVIPVHIGGHPCRMDEILSIAIRHGLKVIEDCAQAHGAEWRGQRVGALGDAGIFSFAQTKNMSAGEGGIIVTKDPEIDRWCREMRNHGRENGSRYEHKKLGGNFRMTEIQGALLREQLKRLDEHISVKHKNAQRLLSGLNSLSPDLFPQQVHPGVTSHGYYSFVINLGDELIARIGRDLFVDALRAEGVPIAGVDMAPYPIYSNPVYAPEVPGARPARITLCPQSERAYKKMLITGQPLGSGLLTGSVEDINDILSAFEKLVSKAHTLEGMRRD